jgi:MFS family permease
LLEPEPPRPNPKYSQSRVAFFLSLHCISYFYFGYC